MSCDIRLELEYFTNIEIVGNEPRYGDKCKDS
jgi:hypothetical protein